MPSAALDTTMPAEELRRLHRVGAVEAARRGSRPPGTAPGACAGRVAPPRTWPGDVGHVDRAQHRHADTATGPLAQERPSSTRAKPASAVADPPWPSGVVERRGHLVHPPVASAPAPARPWSRSGCRSSAWRRRRGGRSRPPARTPRSASTSAAASRIASDLARSIWPSDAGHQWLPLRPGRWPAGRAGRRTAPGRRRASSPGTGT